MFAQTVVVRCSRDSPVKIKKRTLLHRTKSHLDTRLVAYERKPAVNTFSGQTGLRLTRRDLGPKGYTLTHNLVRGNRLPRRNMSISVTVYITCSGEAYALSERSDRGFVFLICAENGHRDWSLACMGTIVPNRLQNSVETCSCDYTDPAEVKIVIAIPVGT